MLRVSVIVPAWNEAALLATALESVDRKPGDELIVCDGASTDGTADIAHRHADRVITAPRGRARQLNAAAAIAIGDVLLFLHADSQLPPGALDDVRDAMADPQCAGGAFPLRIDSPRPLLRIFAGVVNVRSRLFRLPYGDQGLFVRRDVFHHMGGFRDLPIMEDLDFVRRLNQRGRTVLLRQAITTSARRWEANGVWRTSVTHWLAAAMFFLGRSPEAIRRFYDRRLSRGEPTIATNDSATPPARHDAPLRGLPAHD